MAASTTPLNTRSKEFPRRGMIEQGKVMIPTKLVISYRFKKFVVAAADGYLAPAPKLRAYGVIYNDAANGTAPSNYGEPVLLNASGSATGDTLYNSELSTTAATYGPEEATYKTLETSQIIYFNSEYSITNFHGVIDGIEHIARLREAVLFFKQDELSDEQEYKLV